MIFLCRNLCILDMEKKINSGLAPQSPYKKWRLKPYHIKYYGLVFVFLIMIASIKVFINYATMQWSIEQVIKETLSLARHKQYKSIQAYVYSLPESAVFVAHDNSIVLPWERVFFLQSTPDSASNTINWQNVEDTNTEPLSESLSPIQSRWRYLYKKMIDS